MAELTPKTINELPLASSLGANDLIPISSGGAAKRLPGSAILAESGDGYCKLADGTLIQWGVATAQSSGNSITFPSSSAFVRILPTVIVTPAYNSGVTIRCIFGVADITLTGCKVYAYDVTTNALSTATNLAYRWVALGRWK